MVDVLQDKLSRTEVAIEEGTTTAISPGLIHLVQKDAIPDSLSKEKKTRQNPLQILDLEILSLLKTKPMSGYELKKNVMQRFEYNISFGTLYPHLRILENSRLINGTWVAKKPRKRLYTITELGSEKLVGSSKQLSRLLAMITGHEV